MGGSTRRVAVIMAGGSGERFWPLSRKTRPKQLLRIASATQTLIEQAIDRILPLIPADQVFIATTTILHQAMVDAKLPIPEANILAEPAKRNTAGCLSWVASSLMTRYPGEKVSLAILTSDHLIGAPDRFRACVDRALTAAESDDVLVTLGVRPDRPETGYGYIEVGEDPGPVRRVLRFCEKPTLDVAEKFVAGGRHFWNSGMFFWTLDTFVKQMEGASPIHGEVTKSVAAALAAGDSARSVQEFERLPNISIDYALMERSPKVLTVEAEFPWDDVGAWDALERTRTPDADGNIVEGDPVLKDVRSSIVINDAGQANIAVGVIGVAGLLVIVSKDSVLVCPKDAAQEVRHIPRELDRKGYKQV